MRSLLPAEPAVAIGVVFHQTGLLAATWATWATTVVQTPYRDGVNVRVVTNDIIVMQADVLPAAGGSTVRVSRWLYPVTPWDGDAAAAREALECAA